MIKSESRKSNLFSSLRSRRSLKDLSARVQKTSSLISGPFQLSPIDTEPTHGRDAPVAKSPLSPLDLNSLKSRRSSKLYFHGSESQDSISKRHSVAWKKRSSSPASELTLATISAAHSELGSIDTTSIDLPSPTIMEHEAKKDFEGSLEATHLQYTEYADYLNLQEPCIPTRIHRTTNIGDIRKFIESDDKLPMGNRKSLEFEAHEIQTLWAKTCKNKPDEKCTVRILENAFVMTFGPEVSSSERFWDELDVEEIFKGDVIDDAADLIPL